MSKDTFLINFKIENGKLKPLNAIMHSRFNEMLRQSKPNSKIQGVFTVEVPDGTKAQLSKIHAMIGEIAKETGDTFASSLLSPNPTIRPDLVSTSGRRSLYSCNSFSDQA